MPPPYFPPENYSAIPRSASWYSTGPTPMKTIKKTKGAQFKKKASRAVAAPKQQRSAGGGDKTLMTINGRAIRQTPDGRMYVMKNDRKTFI